MPESRTFPLEHCYQLHLPRLWLGTILEPQLTLLPKEKRMYITASNGSVTGCTEAALHNSFGAHLVLISTHHVLPLCQGSTQSISNGKGYTILVIQETLPSWEFRSRARLAQSHDPGCQGNNSCWRMSSIPLRERCLWNRGNLS